MTTGTTQLHVAIVSFSRLRPDGASSAHRLLRSRATWQQLSRSQSSAAKAVLSNDDSQTPVSKNEIPADCFVESSTFPEPCMRRTRKSNEVDLAATRPATLDTPASLERRDYPNGQIPLSDRAKYLFRLGKSYLLFYKTGLKNVWRNSKHYRGMRQKFQGFSLNVIAKYGGETVDARPVPQISRSEYQLCLRTRHDMLKMIPFSLVFLICGEFTPLVIIALGSSIVPYTCRIPRQTQKDLEKKIRQDKQYMEDLPRLAPTLESSLETPDWRVEHLEAYRLGLSSVRNPLPVLGPLIHTFVTRPRLSRHCDNIVSDTLLIHREGGPSNLSSRDMYEWAEAYGLYAFRRYIESCQKTGQDPVSERLKTELLPKVDAEMKYMLNQVADWTRLKPAEQWRVGLRTVGSQSPDWKARARDMREQWKQA